ncbi:HAMP domain-containing histidine kinase [Nocardioides guangzhouensis]|uniref:histidine kinase n=1 Tax=Nocardioides guangzhouensis TaxID=2497878 RepID=A0A4Q4ZBH7_9ACTN|nr:HAMP domain-containing sensor histidine kinase [Nocardioides guangzhouensis]RYP85327.1 HAMP domain-containing histidine kinase [Nocardioides guangzhouensis]
MRSRISWLVVATTSTVVVSFVIPLCLLVRTLAEDRATAAADQEARNVAILVASLSDSPRLPGLVEDLDSRASPETAVLTADGRVLGSDDTSAAELAADPEVRRAVATQEAFTVVDGDGARVLIPVVVAGGTDVVRTEVPSDLLRRGVWPAWLGIVGLGLVLMTLALAIALRLSRRISSPLLEVAGVAHRLREGDLSARAEVRGTGETEELARALNGLADRTVELLAAERAAVADLSHRLRTPVTALRLDAEAVRDPALAHRLQEHIAVLQRTIDAIVRDARRPVHGDLANRSDITAEVRRRCGFWSALAEDQGRPMATDLPDVPLPAPVPGQDVADLVDVLIDNVFAHTPEGTPFRVSLHAGERSVRLVVEDDGPGLGSTSPAPRPGSTGLGLDIARRTAVASGGALVAGPGTHGGTRVEATLPRVAD